MGLGVAYEPTAAWPALNPIFGRIATERAGVTRWTNLVDEMQTNPASQLLQYLPVFITAPLFGFVCGLLLAAFG